MAFKVVSIAILITSLMAPLSQTFSQTTQGTSSLQDEVLRLSIEKQLAQEAALKQKRLQDAINEFTIVHKATTEKILQNFQELRSLNSDLDTYIENDLKNIETIKNWLEGTINTLVTQTDQTSAIQRTEILKTQTAYSETCLNLNSKKLIARVIQLQNDSLKLIDFYQSKATGFLTTEGLEVEFRSSIDANQKLLALKSKELSEMQTATLEHDRGSPICQTLANLPSIIDLIDVHKSIVKFTDVNGLSTISKGIDAFITSIKNEEVVLQKELFIRRYIISIEATYNDYMRRGELEKARQLINRLPQVTKMITNQALLIANKDKRSELENSLLNVSKKITIDHDSKLADNVEVNAVLLRRTRYLYASLLRYQTSKALTERQLTSAKQAGIDVAGKKLDFRPVSDLDQAYLLCETLNQLESEIRM
jgi:hypothetical protein